MNRKSFLGTIGGAFVSILVGLGLKEKKITKVAVFSFKGERIVVDQDMNPIACSGPNTIITVAQCIDHPDVIDDKIDFSTAVFHPPEATIENKNGISRYPADLFVGADLQSCFSSDKFNFEDWIAKNHEAIEKLRKTA